MKREAYSNSHKAMCLRAAPELVFSKLKIQLLSPLNLQDVSMCFPNHWLSLERTTVILTCLEAVYCIYYVFWRNNIRRQRTAFQTSVPYISSDGALWLPFKSPHIPNTSKIRQKRARGKAPWWIASFRWAFNSLVFSFHFLIYWGVNVRIIQLMTK